MITEVYVNFLMVSDNLLLVGAQEAELTTTIAITITITHQPI